MKMYIEEPDKFIIEDYGWMLIWTEGPYKGQVAWNNGHPRSFTEGIAKDISNGTHPDSYYSQFFHKTIPIKVKKAIYEIEIDDSEQYVKEILER